LFCLRLPFFLLFLLLSALSSPAFFLVFLFLLSLLSFLIFLLSFCLFFCSLSSPLVRSLEGFIYSLTYLYLGKI
jgi:hypothetical protein